MNGVAALVDSLCSDTLEAAGAGRYWHAAASVGWRWSRAPLLSLSLLVLR